MRFEAKTSYLLQLQRLHVKSGVGGGSLTHCGYSSRGLAGLCVVGVEGEGAKMRAVVDGGRGAERGVGCKSCCC